MFLPEINADRSHPLASEYPPSNTIGFVIVFGEALSPSSEEGCLRQQQVNLVIVRMGMFTIEAW